MKKSMFRMTVGLAGGMLLIATELMADNTVDFSSKQSVASSVGLTLDEDSPANKDEILEVVRRFAQTCPTLFTSYAGDVVSAKAFETYVQIYREEQYGWQREIALEVRMDQDASVAPGHLLTYYFGDGENPGWLVQKAQSLEPCEREGNDAGDTFVPVNDFFES